MIYILNFLFLIVCIVFFETKLVVAQILIVFLTFVSLRIVERRVKLLGPIVIPSVNLKKISKYALGSSSLYFVELAPKAYDLKNEIFVILFIILFIILKTRRQNDL